MRWVFRVLVLMTAVAVLAVIHPPVRAEDLDALLHKGVELRRQGREQEAFALFKRAAQIKKTPRVMTQLAFVEQALGQWVNAERDLTAALEGKTDPWMVKNRAVIDEGWRAIQNHLGSLEVWGTPSGAEILVDGEAVGSLPSSGALRLPLGQVSLTVRHLGFVEVTRVVEIGRDRLTRENVNLHALPRPLSATSPVGIAATPSPALLVTKPIEGPAPESVGRDSGESRPLYRRWWFWTVLVAVAIGAGTTGYLVTRPAKISMVCDPGIPCGTWGSP